MPTLDDIRDMSPEQQSIEQLRAYLAGRLSLADLNEWLGPRIWDDTATHLDNDVYLRLCEYSYGHWPIDALKRELHQLLMDASDAPAKCQH